MHVRHINMEMFSVTTSVDTLSNDFCGFSDVNRVAFPFLFQAAMCETATHPKKLQDSTIMYMLGECG